MRTEERLNMMRSVESASLPYPTLCTTARESVWQKGTFSTICRPMGLVKPEVRVKVSCPMMVERRNMRIPSASFPGTGKGPLISEEEE